MLLNGQAVRQARPMRRLLEPQLSFMCSRQRGQTEVPAMLGASIHASIHAYAKHTYTNCDGKCLKSFCSSNSIDASLSFPFYVYTTKPFDSMIFNPNELFEDVFNAQILKTPDLVDHQ